MDPGDALAAAVRRYVADRVAPELVGPVSEATCATVSLLMADPSFTRQLRVVQELLEEIQWLKTQILHQQRIMALSTTGTRGRSKPSKPRKGSAAAMKKAAPRTTSSRTTTASSSRTTTSGSPRRAATPAQKAFRAGFKQARR